jgi:putative hydrolase of the HAD superfamily
VSHSNVRAVAFDLYGVMTSNPFTSLEAHGAELGLVRGSMSAPFTTARWLDDVQLGHLPREEFVKELAQQMQTTHGVDIDEPLVVDVLERSLDAVPAMVELVKEIRCTCRTALLTNNIRQSVFWVRGLPDDLFDVVVDPTSTGRRKPDPAVYQVLIEALGCAPEAVVFVDDSAANLVPARDAGIATIHFEGVASCRDELRALGVAVTTPVPAASRRKRLFHSAVPWFGAAHREVSAAGDD